MLFLFGRDLIINSVIAGVKEEVIFNDHLQAEISSNMQIFYQICQNMQGIVIQIDREDEESEITTAIK